MAARLRGVKPATYRAWRGRSADERFAAAMDLTTLAQAIHRDAREERS